MSAECRKCMGYGEIRSGFDTTRTCPDCHGVGWADGCHRTHCDRCKAVEKLDDMHVSPDEDGNRTVCPECLALLERRHSA